MKVNTVLIDLYEPEKYRPYVTTLKEGTKEITRWLAKTA